MYSFLLKDEPPPSTEATIGDFFFILASAILFFLFSNIFLSSIIFLLRGHLMSWIPFLSFFLAIPFTLFYGKFFFKKYRLAAMWIIIAAIGIFVLSVLANRTIYDISYDGQTYQQEAVIQLSNGWNPDYQILDPAVIGGEEKWINYYPKSSWINESYLYLLTHSEQSAKALNIILILVSIALLYTALTDAKLVNKFDAWILSLVIGCNPVSLNQMFSFYLDGQLCSLFLCLCAIGIIMYTNKRSLSFIPLFLAIPIFVNLKFTALLDAFIFLFILMLALWMKRNEYLTLKTFMVGGVAISIGVLLVGFSPYVTNVIRYQTPFYPLLGPNAIDLKPYNVPGNFIEKNSTEIMFLSFFSQSGGIKNTGTTSSYKIPFTYSNNELAAFNYPDPVEGGFGPLFGGLIILTVIIMIGYYLALKKIGYKEYRRKFYGALWLMIAIFLICVVDPIASLARYVPQAYLLAIVPVILLLNMRKTWPRTVGYLMIAVLCFNSYLIAKTYIGYNIKISSEIAADLNTLAQESQKKSVRVYFNEFRSTRMMLDEAGVNYTVTNNPNSCLKGFRELLPENTTEFCITG